MKAVNTVRDGGIHISLYHTEQAQYFTHATRFLILATGYRYSVPGLLQAIKDRIQWNKKGEYLVKRNYSVDVTGNEIFVLNGELHTHGFTTPDLGMGPYRNATILNEILGYAHFSLEKNIAFQDFSVV